MQEQPITCSAEEVRGLLDGTLTELRRDMDPQPEQDAKGYWRWNSGVMWWGSQSYLMADYAPHKRSDVLWVREPFYYDTEQDNYYFQADNKGMGTAAYIRLSGLPPDTLHPLDMPKDACRLKLTVTSVSAKLADGKWKWRIGVERKS